VDGGMVVSTQVRMANDIAAQFRHLRPDAAAAVLADHVRQFWEPRMRTQLQAAVADGAEGVDPVVAAAAALLGGGDQLATG
jgi:formate dehydrogenase subunit delta